MSAAPVIDPRRLPREAWRAAVGSAVLALAICQLSACALTGSAPSAVTPAATTAASPATTAMLAALANRERSLRSMQSGAIMEYSAADGHHFRTHEEIALARPASMRVEAVAPFGATMVLAADDAGRLMIFDPSKNILMSGGANAATLERYVRIPLAPQAAVDLLMGLAPDAAQLATPPDSVSDTEGMTIALWRLGDGGTRELGFIAGQLAMVRERDSAGAQRYDVRYSDWRDASGMSFPDKVKADFPASRITLRYEGPTLNTTLAPALFVLTPAPGTKQISIDAGASAAPGAAG
jgi:outer membrane lipoprotein-sorting protein